MEYTQWDLKLIVRAEFEESLNPCCNGIYSMREFFQWVLWIPSLNPCCNGIYSMRGTGREMAIRRVLVLILVVMEYTQWDFQLSVQNKHDEVLILVVMEYTQWVFYNFLVNIR